MKSAKWDQIATDYRAGRLTPANGVEAWQRLAEAEVMLIHGIIPPSTRVLIEVGCGVGRHTPHLAALYERVIAFDTSRVCRDVTRKLCADTHPNVTVQSPGKVAADAALVWDMYDDDWSDAEANGHLTDLLFDVGLVLVQTYRQEIIEEHHGYIVRRSPTLALLAAPPLPEEIE